MSNRSKFGERLGPELRMWRKFLENITMNQVVVRLVAAEAKLAAQAEVVRQAIRLAKSESNFFSDEEGASHRVRPSSLKRAVAQMQRQEWKV